VVIQIWIVTLVRCALAEVCTVPVLLVIIIIIINRVKALIALTPTSGLDSSFLTQHQTPEEEASVPLHWLSGASSLEIKC